MLTGSEESQDAVSRDIYFYKVRPVKDKVTGPITEDSIYQDSDKYHLAECSRASGWMKDIGQKVVVEYTSIDYHKMSQNLFQSDYDNITFGIDYLVFCYKGKTLGRVEQSCRQEYEYVARYDAYLFKRELIGAPEDSYCLYSMEDRLYTCEELRQIADQIEQEEGAEYHYESLYTLLKAAFVAQDGKAVWCSVC